jgi:RES domain-containing protein
MRGADKTDQVIGWRLAADDDWEAAERQDKAGRWHYAGDRIVYGSRSPELAVLEALAHHRAGKGGPYWMCRILGPADATMQQVDPDALPAGWRQRKPVTRALGRRWLRAAGSVLLQVPSAVCTRAWNVLVNPALAGPPCWRIERVSPFRFDRRLVLRG